MPIPYDRTASLVSHHPSLIRDGGPARGGVTDAQRAQVMEALVQTVADVGYARATIAEVVRAAGVSRSTFLRSFPDKEACFLTAYELGMEVLEQRIADAATAATEDGWRGRLQDGLREYLQVLEDDRVFAYAFVVEIHQTAPDVVRARDAFADRMAERFLGVHRDAVAAGEAEGEPPREVFLTLVEGVEALVARALRTGRPATLPGLEPVVLDAALRMLRGA